MCHMRLVWLNMHHIPCHVPPPPFCVQLNVFTMPKEDDDVIMMPLPHAPMSSPFQPASSQMPAASAGGAVKVKEEGATPSGLKKSVSDSKEAATPIVGLKRVASAQLERSDDNIDWDEDPGPSTSKGGKTSPCTEVGGVVGLWDAWGWHV